MSTRMSCSATWYLHLSALLKERSLLWPRHLKWMASDLRSSSIQFNSLQALLSNKWTRRITWTLLIKLDQFRKCSPSSRIVAYPLKPWQVDMDTWYRTRTSTSAWENFADHWSSLVRLRCAPGVSNSVCSPSSTRTCSIPRTSSFSTWNTSSDMPRKSWTRSSIQRCSHEETISYMSWMFSLASFG